MTTTLYSLNNLLAILSYIVFVVQAEDNATLTVSENPVYSGDSLNLTCSFEDPDAMHYLYTFTMTAFNSSHLAGSFSCNTEVQNVNNNTITGVFVGHKETRCSSHSSNVTLSLTASPSLELVFNCSIDAVKYGYVVPMRSGPVFVVVNVRPSAPKLKPDPLIFDEEENAIVRCESLEAKPAAEVRLIVSQIDGTNRTSTGLKSTLLALPPPLANWQNATALCAVTNYNMSNATVSGIIGIYRNRSGSTGATQFSVNQPRDGLLTNSNMYSSTLSTTSPLNKRIHYGYASLTVNKNPIYSGQQLNLTCAFEDPKKEFLLRIYMIAAYNSTHQTGFLSCNTNRRITNGTGIFLGHNVTGCSTHSVNVTLSMIASPTIELVFNCSIKISNESHVVTMRSAPVFVVLNVRPSVPKITPDPLVFNEEKNAIVRCESMEAKPAAVVILSVSQIGGRTRMSAGLKSTLLALPPPLENWQNATALCAVTNHDISNLIVSRIIGVHLSSKTSVMAENRWCFTGLIGFFGRLIARNAFS